MKEGVIEIDDSSSVILSGKSIKINVLPDGNTGQVKISVECEIPLPAADKEEDESMVSKTF